MPDTSRSPLIIVYARRLLPLIAIGAIVGLYVLLNMQFVTCKDNCGKEQSTALYQIDPKTANLSDVNATLKVELAKVEANANAKAAIANTTAATTPAAPTGTPKLPANGTRPTPPPATSAANANPAPSNAAVADKLATGGQKKQLTEKQELEQEIRGKAAARYSFQMYWVFLSGILLFLSLSVMAVGLYTVATMLKGPEKTFWILATIGSAALATLLLWLWRDDYMALVLPMFQQSFDQSGRFTPWMHFFNITGFAAAASVIVASAGLYWHVSAKKETDGKATYDDERFYAKTILYIGAAMLFVSAIRLDLQFEWHLSYVPEHLKDGLSGFFSSILAVQAAFYTIVLGLVYLPFASLPKTGDAAKEKAGEPTAGGKMFSILPDPLPKLLAIISPFLAGPIAELVKFLTG